MSDQARALAHDGLQFKAGTAASLWRSRWLTPNTIGEEICVATHVTVDLSGFNANVCLEPGIADTIGRRTLRIGGPGTERGLQKALPGVSKRRCLAYSRDAGGMTSFAAGVQRFFAAMWSQVAARSACGDQGIDRERLPRGSRRYLNAYETNR